MDAHLPFPILFPKVQIPPSRLRLVSRRRLLQVLDAGLHRKLTLLSAPAGYGKSTLLSEWAASCDWPLGWVTIEAGDNDMERFLTYLVSAVETAGAGSPGLQGLLGERFSLQPLPMEAVLAILVNQLPAAFERLVVILDDYHHIDSPEIHSFISALIDHLPANIHLIISTRADPPLRLARLRAKDQLNEITESDLRFTLEEASAFFKDVMGLYLTLDQIAELEERTEGWVTGLQLAGLSLKEREHPIELSKTLTGTHHYFLDYLLQEVFFDLPDDLQTFLLRVSILERLSPDLCDAVVGELNGDDETGTPRRSRGILEFMDASNLFVVPMDSQRQWYRFHPLFADFLRDRLVTHHGNELPELHRRAAGWYREHGLLSEAVGHSFAGGDVNLAADLIQTQAKDLLTRGEIMTLNRWIAKLTEEALQARPRLGLARAWAMLMRDPLAFRDKIESQIYQIAHGFGIQPQNLLNSLAESEPGSERRAGLGEFAMLQAFAQRDIANANQTIELFKAAYEFLPENEDLLRGFTLAGLASTYARVGAIKQAEQVFAQAAQSSRAAGSIFGYVANTDWQATMQAEQGQLKRAAATYRQAIETLSGQGQHPLPLSGHVYVGLASVLLEWNDLDGALEHVQAGLQVGNQVRDFDALLKGYVVQARVLQALGKGEDAYESVRESERIALETKNLGCIHETQAWKAYLALAAGDVQEAQRWAEARGLVSGKEVPSGESLDEIEQFTFARLLMAGGKAAETLPILKVLANLQEQNGRTRAHIESLALEALCLRSLGRMDEGVRILARSLLLAEPDGFARVFIQEGPPMAALLRTAGGQGHSPEYVKRLLECFVEIPSSQETVLDPLSERELEILGLVAEGLTNAEIAAELVIALSTVKTHINRIYSKLGVSTRTQAVARARQLQILP
jgi:LuxR family maltose regulon positive regulatory protein